MSGIFRSPDLCHPAPSRTATAWLPGSTAALMSPGCRFILTVFARQQHRAWHGTIFRSDHRFWRTRYPGGWQSRCTEIQLSDGDLKECGWEQSEAPPEDWNQTREWINPWTGDTHRVPVGIDPRFQFNVGMVDRSPGVGQFLIQRINAADLGLARVATSEPWRAQAFRLHAERKGVTATGRKRWSERSGWLCWSLSLA